MPADRPTDTELRQALSAERAQLAEALADLRQAVDGRRKLAGVLGKGLATGVAAAALFRVARRLRGG